MSPIIPRRLAAIVACSLFVVSTSLVGPDTFARGGSDPGSPPAPNAFGADTVGVLAAPRDVVDHVGIVWDEIIDPTSLPAAGDFAVRVNGGPPIAPTAVTLLYSGLADEAFLSSAGGLSFMRLDLGFTWTAGTDQLTLSYTPGASPIRDFALNEAQAFSELSVEPWDFIDLFVIGPVVDERHGRNRILVGISLPIDSGSIPVAADFTVDVGGSPLGVLSVTQLFADMGMGILDLELASTVDDPGLAVTLDYQPGANPIRSTRDGSQLGAFSLPVLLLLTSDSASATLAPGGTLSTATPDGTTVADPLATSVTSPTGGDVSISEGPVTEPSTAGYAFFGQQVEITAPVATPESPLLIRFDIDASLIPVGEDASTIEIMRNGAVLPDCTGADGVADPDPCVSERITLADGDISITVLTSQASTWNLAILPPYEFGGFEPPVNGDVPNLAAAGSAIPVRFSLGGFRGMDIFSAGSPSVHLVSCTTLEPGADVEETVTAGASSLSYDASSDGYTYVWKTHRAWTDSCRRLLLDFTDGSQEIAVFDFRR